MTLPTQHGVDAIEGRVIKCLNEQVGRFVPRIGYVKPQVKVDSTLTEDLALDSIDIAEVRIALEDEFEIKIDDGQMYELKTVQDVVDSVRASLEIKS